MPKGKQHGTGAHHRVIPPEEEVLGRELAGSAPDFSKPTGLAEPPDEDQGSSNSCTSQAFGYFLWQLTGGQMVRNDTYSHTFIQGGGAYLTAPPDFVAQFGALIRGAFQDPNPETESNMEHVILQVNQDGRVSIPSLRRLTIHPDINTIGSLLEQYKGIIIGVDGSDAGWKNMVDPVYNGVHQWGHALYIYDRAIRNGKKALKAKSSWCNEVKDHFINEDYFKNGGVFEALAIVIEETNMQLVNDNGTWKLVGDKGYIGIADPAALAKLQALSSTTGTSTVTVPQVGVFKSVAIDKETSISVLGND